MTPARFATPFGPATSFPASSPGGRLSLSPPIAAEILFHPSPLVRRWPGRIAKPVGFGLCRASPDFRSPSNLWSRAPRDRGHREVRSSVGNARARRERRPRGPGGEPRHRRSRAASEDSAEWGGRCRGRSGANERPIVEDDHRADDVAQSTIAAALARPPARPNALGSWLRRVARNFALKEIRSRRRVTDRERRASRTERIPAADVEIARRDAARAVSESIAELAEPYRSAIVRRYYDGLSSREVAAETGIPVETVRTREKRAMSLLRARVVARLDGRRGLPGAVALLALVESRRVPEGLALRAHRGAARRDLAALASVAAAVALVATWVEWPAGRMGALEGEWPTDPLAPRFVSPERSPREEARPVGNLGGVESPGPVQNSSVQPGETATGGLEIHVHWSDGSSAAGIRFAVDPVGNGDAPRPMIGQNMRHETDAAGFVKIVGLAPGCHVLTFDRSILAPEARVVVGRTTIARVDLPDGLDVEGRFVSRGGAPIASADVILCSFARSSDSGVVVARTGDDGRLAVRDVSALRWVGARVPGFAPAHMVMVEGGGAVGPRHVALRVPRPGARVAGEVRGAAGRPLGGAEVVMDVLRPSTSMSDDGQFITLPAPLRVLTDRDGRFVIEDAFPAPSLRFVSSPDHAPTSTEVELASGGSLEVSMSLASPAIVAGVVRGARSEPIAGADIWVIDSATSRFRAPVRTRSGPDGAFRVAGLAAGPVRVMAVASGSCGLTGLSLEAGRTDAVEIALAAGPGLAGRVASERGEPLAGVRVVAEAPATRIARVISKPMYEPPPVEANDSVAAWPLVLARSIATATAWTGEDGRFVFEGRVPAPHVLELFEPGVPDGMASERVFGAEPGTDVEIVVRDARRASGVLAGTVRGLVAEPVEGATVRLHSSGREPSAFASAITDSNGAFKVAGIVPGRYRLSVESPEGARTYGRHVEIGPGQSVDAGEIRFVAAGGLRARVFRISDAAAAVVGARVVDEELAGDWIECDDLPPGNYWLLVPGFRTSPIAAQAAAFTVRSDEVTDLDVTIEPGVPVWIQMREDAPTDLPIDVRIEDAGGRLVFVARSAPRIDGVHAVHVSLPRGTFRVRASNNAGFAGSHDVAVDDGLFRESPFWLRLTANSAR